MLGPPAAGKLTTSKRMPSGNVWNEFSMVEAAAAGVGAAARRRWRDGAASP